VTALFAFASELLGPMLDTAADPVDSAVRSLRFAELVERDSEIAWQLTDPPLGDEDIKDAPLGVWAWWLDWRRTRSEAPPPAQFLAALYNLSPDPLVRLRVVQAETWHPRWVAEFRERARFPTPTLRDLPHGFVGDGLRTIAGLGFDHNNERLGTSLDPDEIAVHLLQLGDPSSLAALRALVDAAWDGALELRERYGVMLGWADGGEPTG